MVELRRARVSLDADGNSFYLIWFEKDFNGEWIPRALGVLSIAVAALTILTPILHKLSNQTLKTEETDAEIARLKTRIAELELLKGKITNDDAN